MNFKQWSLYAKIYLIVGLLIAAGVGTTFVTLQGLNETTASMQEINDVHNEVRALGNYIRDQQSQMMILNRNIILRTDPKDMLAAKTAFDQANIKQDEFLAALLVLGDAEQKAAVQEITQIKVVWLKIIRKFQELGLQNKNEEANRILFDEAGPLTVKMNEWVEKIRQSAIGKAKSEMAKALEKANRAIKIGIAVGSISLLAAMALTFLIIRSLKSAIQRVVEELSSAATKIATASTQVASSSEELSQSVTEQAASLEQTAASVEEINSMVTKSTENAKMSAETSNTAQNKAVEGKSAVEQMLSSMDDINRSNQEIMRQTEESNRQMADILKVIEEIGSKTKVINDIVFQTKLLSFNASVEAARAGEQGKGFAVVAEEVGNLAQMSGNAAKEISDMLGASMQKVESIARQNKEKVEALISQGKSKVDSGIDVARQCSAILEEIVQNISQVSTMAREISTANQEQAQGITEINKAVGQLDQVTQQNAATGTQTANAAESMSSQVEMLKKTVDHLVQTIEGGDKGGSHAQALPIAKATAKPETKPSAKVLNFKSQPKAKTVSTEPAPKLKSAVGAGSLPHSEDPRFEDI